jgi:hypothetical protein
MTFVGWLRQDRAQQRCDIVGDFAHDVANYETNLPANSLKAWRRHYYETGACEGAKVALEFAWKRYKLSGRAFSRANYAYSE